LLVGIRAHRTGGADRESLPVPTQKITIAKMGMLKDAGVTLSIDDFGIGYSMIYLKYLPRTSSRSTSFVKDVLDNDAAIARTIIGLAQAWVTGVDAERRGNRKNSAPF
jgi:EAL domain-containing protein (putative c-di-GMP-specific phosphodiesterase class I)